MVRRIVTSVEGLTVAAESVGSGDLSYRVPVTHHDQLGHLGEVFNHIEDRTAATKQLRDLADYAESCIESLNRR